MLQGFFADNYFDDGYFDIIENAITPVLTQQGVIALPISSMTSMNFQNGYLYIYFNFQSNQPVSQNPIVAQLRI